MANLWTPGSGDTSGERTVAKLKAFSARRSTDMSQLRQAMIDDGTVADDAEARAAMRASYVVEPDYSRSGEGHRITTAARQEIGT